MKQWAVNRYPQLPYFMMGHSMGSFALRNYLQDYPVTVQGVIFMGTGTSPLPLTAALPLLKMRNSRKNQLRSLISWHLVLLAKIS